MSFFKVPPRQFHQQKSRRWVNTKAAPPPTPQEPGFLGAYYRVRRTAQNVRR